MLFSEIFKNQFEPRFDAAHISINHKSGLLSITLLDEQHHIRANVYFDKYHDMYIEQTRTRLYRYFTTCNAKLLFEKLLNRKLTDIEYKFILKANEQFELYIFTNSTIYDIDLQS